MKKIQTVIEKAEKTNEYGVKTINELVEFKKVFKNQSGEERAIEVEYVWYQSIGEHTSSVCRYKKESAMRKKMEEYDFFMKNK